MPQLSEIQNHRYLEWIVQRNDGFLGTVAAAMQHVAVQVFFESPDTPGYDERRQIAENIIRIPSEQERLLPLFVTAVLQDQGLRGQVFDTSGPDDVPIDDRVKPWRMDALALDQAIGNAWNIAAGVQVEGGDS